MGISATLFDPRTGDHGAMELVGITVVVLTVVGIGATVSALRRDGPGHNPPVRSDDYRSARDLPSVSHTLRIF